MTVSKELYLKRKLNSLCVRCGKDIDNKFTHCSVCILKRINKNKRKYDKRKIEGRCLKNGCIGPCQCQLKFTTWQKQVRADRVLNNLCVDGCGQKTIGKSKYCLDCFCKAASRNAIGSNLLAKELKNKLIEQDFTCIYSGRKLVPGINASIDHITPVSKNGLDNINNLQWIDTQINTMKTDMDHDDFLSTCYKIGNKLRFELVT